jgi:hypothetical protein
MACMLCPLASAAQGRSCTSRTAGSVGLEALCDKCCVQFMTSVLCALAGAAQGQSCKSCTAGSTGATALLDKFSVILTSVLCGLAGAAQSHCCKSRSNVEILCNKFYVS